MNEDTKKETAERRLNRGKQSGHHPKCVKPCRDSPVFSASMRFLFIAHQ